MKKTICIATALFMAFGLNAAGALPFDELVKCTTPMVYTNAQHKTMPYRFYISPNVPSGKMVPLVVFLHGSGECGSENVSNLVNGVGSIIGYSIARHEPICVVVPQCARGRVWAPLKFKLGEGAFDANPTLEETMIKGIVDRTMLTNPIAPEQVLVTGLSLGGYGTWALLSHYPDVFAAAMPLCGGGYPETCRLFAKTPIWVFHGESDPTVDVRLSREMVSALWKLDSPVRYREIPDAGHCIWNAVYSDEAVLKWFLSRKRRVELPPGSYYF